MTDTPAQPPNEVESCPSCKETMVISGVSYEYNGRGEAVTRVTWLCRNPIHGLTRVTANRTKDGICEPEDAQ